MFGVFVPGLSDRMGLIDLDGCGFAGIDPSYGPASPTRPSLAIWSGARLRPRGPAPQGGTESKERREFWHAASRDVVVLVSSQLSAASQSATALGNDGYVVHLEVVIERRLVLLGQFLTM